MGRAEEGVVPVITRLVGAAPAAVFDDPECGRIYVWPGGLELAFRSGDLVGWRATGPGYETLTGVSIGDPEPADAEVTGGVAVAVRDGFVADLAVGPRCPGGQDSM